MRSVLIVTLMLSLSACATPPRNTRNACAVFDQRDGWFNNWRRAAQSTSREYGVPVSILMATIYTESGYRSDARPPRTKLLGFIPWSRPSTAYGYSQALDGTWDRYQRETGRGGARRGDFADAIRFIGWYHYQSHVKVGIPLDDPYSLYLAYYSGHDGYARGAWRSSATAQAGARRFTEISQTYARQLQSCPD